MIANNPALLANPASAAEYGKPILTVQNPYGPPGSPSPNSPPFQFNARLRYQWALNTYNLFAQAGVIHTAHSYTQSGSNPPLSAGSAISTNLLRFEDPAYTEYDASDRHLKRRVVDRAPRAESHQRHQQRIHDDSTVLAATNDYTAAGARRPHRI